MAKDKGGVVAEVKTIKEAITTINALVTKELEISYTDREIAEMGGIAAAKGQVLLECAKYGTIVFHEVDATVV